MIDGKQCTALKELHEGNAPFVIPNPWDAGSARVLEGVGFKALATSSAGLACTLGLSDGDITLADCLAHCRLVARATSIPVNCDFEEGFAADPAEVAHNVLAVTHTGIAGCSIEDWSRDESRLYDFDHAVERVAAAAEAARSLGAFPLTARAENLLRGVDDLDDTVRRLQAFADAGAHRISLGGALNWVSIGALHRAARAMLDDGSMTWLAEAAEATGVRKYLG